MIINCVHEHNKGDTLLMPLILRERTHAAQALILRQQKCSVR